jgi:Flp pilus assembly protein TadD
MRIDRVCPSCGTRNKPKWEFCVRCGETLGEELDRPEVTVAVGATGGQGAIAWRPWVMAGLLVAATVASFLLLRRISADRPDPALFTMGLEPTVPPASPAATPPRLDDPARVERTLAHGKVLEALPLLADQVARNPEDAKVRRLYAQALAAAGRHEDASSEWRALTRLAPGDAEARFSLARTLDHMGRTGEAAEAYADLLAAAPNHGEGLRLSAGLWTRQGRHGEALPLLRRLVELNPGDLTARQDLAFALEKTGEPAGAAEVYAGIVASMPTASIARSRLAEVLTRQGHPERAVTLYREGLSLQPTHPFFHLGLAGALERVGQPLEAAAAYREFLRLAPNNPDAKQLAARAARLEKQSASS